MKVTDVKYKKTERGNNKQLGIADIVVDGVLVIKGIRVTMGKYGPFISFPSRKGEDSKYYDIVFPITKELRTVFTDAILKEASIPESVTKPEEKPDKDFWNQ